MVTLVLFVNLLTAVLTFGALIGYGLVYTIWLNGGGVSLG
jgi:heme O synthase-like polyprenyltransferase